MRAVINGSESGSKMQRSSILLKFLLNSQLHKIHKCQTNDSPVEYSCRISRQKTALTERYLCMTHSSSWRYRQAFCA